MVVFYNFNVLYHIRYMHYEMKPYPLSSSAYHRSSGKVVLKRESEAIHVGCVTEGMDNDRVGYNAATAQCGIQVCMYVCVTGDGMIIVTYKGFCDIKLYNMNIYERPIIVF